MLIVVISPHIIEMSKGGTADPELVAGAVSESIVSGVLGSFIDLPILFIGWFVFRRAKLNRL